MTIKKLLHQIFLKRKGGKTSAKIVDLLLKINSTGVAVMLITHDSSICSRILSEASAPVFYHIENGLVSSEGLNNSCNS